MRVGSCKGRLLAGVALVALALAGPASAADMPVKAPPRAATPWSWAGFYVGGHAGYGWGRNHFTITDDPFFFGKSPGFSSGGYDLKGPLGGLHAGANWQDGSVVGGLEIDLTWTDIRGSSSGSWGPNFIPAPDRNEFGTATHSGKFSMLGTARARLGYALRPDVLLYGTGGLAWTRFVENTDLVSARVFLAPPESDAMILSSAISTWRFGWVAGVGGEVRLWDSNWLARVEYLHYDFGKSASNSEPNPFLPGAQFIRTSGNVTLDVVRAGLSYKFYPFVVASAPSAAGAPIAKAPVRIPWTWSGYYLGAHAGYGWGQDPFSTIMPANGVPLSGVDSDGFVAGFQAGANWQDGSVVGGLEIDISGTGIKGSTSNAVGAASRTQTDKFDRLGSARARLGYLVTPNLMLYGTGGLGWTRLVTDEVIVGPLARTTETPNWLFGWVAGVGLETRLWESNWLARIEYLHYDFGDGASVTRVNSTDPSRFPDVTTTSGRLTNDVVRAALSYKLDWPGAVGVGRAVVPAKAPAAWTWSGFYIGGHAGYGWGRDPFEELVTGFQVLNFVSPAVVLHGPKSKGFVGGFQAGANWQTGAFVGGLEIDLSKTGIKGSSSAAGFDVNSVPVSATQTDKFDLLGSVRARLGYLPWPSVLVYGTGGLAWTRFEQDATRVAPFWWGTTTSSTPSWRFGWVAGIGSQARLWNTNWIARAEYLHYDFGNSGNAVRGFLADGQPDSFEASVLSSGNLTTDVVRIGLDYKLN